MPRELDGMCRNIRTLHNFEPPATRDEVHAAAVHYVRKVRGATKLAGAGLSTDSGIPDYSGPVAPARMPMTFQEKIAARCHMEVLGPVPDRLRSSSWWFRSSDGSLSLWQPPNPALCVWMVTLVLGRFELSATHATALNGVRHGALLVWALDEVVRGASPFRRVLGAVILAAQLASLVRG